MGRKISVTILWHMHQPPYHEPRNNVFLLPWTFLHGMKDYYDMGATIKRHPNMRANVNFTACLLEQLDQYANDLVPDQTLLVMSKSPESLTQTEREYLHRTCFGIPQTMAAPIPKYRELFEVVRKAKAQGRPIDSVLEPQDYLDLIVVFLLSWCGPTLQQHPVVIELMEKGRDFSTDDRDLLIKTARAFIGEIVPLWKELAQSGQVELSTTPFNHPILPLLIDNSVAAQANPHRPLPDVRFQAPEEAQRQLDCGLGYFEQTFGFPTQGMWPAEGSVSEAAIKLFKSRNVRWVATDEEILHRSLGGSLTNTERFSPHVKDGVSIFFRDHFLSDQIGFVYSRWPKEQAVSHFISELEHRARAADSDSAHVFVALDGENAWEFYADGGYPFLDALYEAMTASDLIEPVTLAQYLNTHGPGIPLQQLKPGSWISGDFTTWIGDPVKNRAWELLSDAWMVAQDSLDKPEASRLRTLMLRAEASDWFWWFGEGHVSIHEREFDYLFRQNLRAIYEELDMAVPRELDQPIGDEKWALPIKQPSARISPKISGKRGGFYKWIGAGSSEFAQGSIHRLNPVIAKIKFGYDYETFYMRLEGVEPLKQFFEADGSLTIEIHQPTQKTLAVLDGQLMLDDKPVPQAKVATGEVMEISLPMKLLCAESDRFTLEFHLVLRTGELEAERFPWDSTITVDVDPYGFELTNWFI